MDDVIGKLLGAIRLGRACSGGALTLLPVFGDLPAGPAYVTLGEAIAAGTLVVTEVDPGGSVPELRAINRGKKSVLILDGEELAGARQNRVLNTTVLLGAGKDVLLPVSCTEHGRWHYLSERFEDSGYVASHRVRQAVHESVTANLRVSGVHRSDQGRVWDEVADVSDRAGVRSDTSALRDAYEQRRRETDELIQGIQPEDGQIGVLAVADGRVMGLDLVSRPEAYARLHEKLIRSYGFEAMVDHAKPGAGDTKAAKRFIAELASLDGTEHDCVGSGSLHRYTGTGASGSALTWRNAIVHAAFFRSDPAAGAGGIVRWERRAGFRGGTCDITAPRRH